MYILTGQLISVAIGTCTCMDPSHAESLKLSLAGLFACLWMRVFNKMNLIDNGSHD